LLGLISLTSGSQPAPVALSSNARALPAAVAAQLGLRPPVSPDQGTIDVPQFWGEQNGQDLNATVVFNGTGLAADNDQTTSATAAANATLNGFFGPPATFEQQGLGTITLTAPLYPDGGTELDGTVAVNNQQSVTGGGPVPGLCQLTTTANGNATFGLASSGPDSIQATLTETATFSWTGPNTANGALPVAVGGGGSVGSTNFNIAWNNGAMPVLNFVNSASNVLTNSLSAGSSVFKIETPVTLPVFPNTLSFAVGYGDRIMSNLAGNLPPGTNGEQFNLTYIATLST
jgi:hypothetical protein